jgi:tetratricopeptide (TPR) repeat protein
MAWLSTGSERSTWDQGKAAAAADHLEQALRANPELPGGAMDLGRAYLQAGRHQEAAAALERAAAAEENERIHYLLSQAYLKLGRREEAQAQIARYQELNRKRLEQVQKDVKSVSESLAERPATREAPRSRESGPR